MVSITELIFEGTSLSLLEGDLEEAAMSIADAESNNLALMVTKEETYTVLVLYNPIKVYEVLSKLKPKARDLSPFIRANSIIGFMSLEVDKKNVTKVVSVAAEKGYGPLMYELASNLFGLITSDRDVKPAAEGVWKRFYDRKDVKKKFLKDKETPNKGPWGMDERPYPLKQDPLMYGYVIPKKQSLKKLMNNHEQALVEMAKSKKMPTSQLQAMLSIAAGGYFEQRYDNG